MLLLCAVSRADLDVSTMGEPRFAQVDNLPAPQLIAPPSTQPPMQMGSPLPTAAYPQTPTQTFPATQPLTYPPSAELSHQQLQIIPPELICKESPFRNDSWTIEFDLIPTLSEFTESEFGDWTDKGTLAFRLSLGFEDDIGFGTRVRLWAFGQEFSTPATRIELGASTLNVDLYRRLYIEDAELVIGGGPVGAALQFEFPQMDERSRFGGGGATVFGEAYFPFVHWAKTDLASVVRARLSVLRGEWHDSGTPLVPDSDHDSMTIADVAWGLELRRRFGRREDKYWLIRILPEYQRWDSAWLGEFADSNIAFIGTDISFGVAW
jgi:hypothetical protein